MIWLLISHGSLSSLLFFQNFIHSRGNDWPAVYVNVQILHCFFTGRVIFSHYRGKQFEIKYQDEYYIQCYHPGCLVEQVDYYHKNDLAFTSRYECQIVFSLCFKPGFTGARQNEKSFSETSTVGCVQFSLQPNHSLSEVSAYI